MNKVNKILVAGSIAVASLGMMNIYAASSTETTGQYVSNSGITAKVKTAVLAQSGLKSQNISVTTNNGVVILSGTVDTAAESQLAEETAQGVSGVKSVQNNLTTRS